MASQISDLSYLITFEKEVEQKEKQVNRFLHRDEIIIEHSRLFHKSRKYL
jgi:hypothetical protein